MWNVYRMHASISHGTSRQKACSPKLVYVAQLLIKIKLITRLTTTRKIRGRQNTASFCARVGIFVVHDAIQQHIIIYITQTHAHNNNMYTYTNAVILLAILYSGVVDMYIISICSHLNQNMYNTLYIFQYIYMYQL